MQGSVLISYVWSDEGGWKHGSPPFSLFPAPLPSLSFTECECAQVCSASAQGLEPAGACPGYSQQECCRAPAVANGGEAACGISKAAVSSQLSAVGMQDFKQHPNFGKLTDQQRLALHEGQELDKTIFEDMQAVYHADLSIEWESMSRALKVGWLSERSYCFICRAQKQAASFAGGCACAGRWGAQSHLQKSQSREAVIFCYLLCAHLSG